MHVAITKEDTTFGVKGKFPGIIGTEIQPACTSKNTEHRVIWFLMKQDFEGGRELKNF
jgi:hypothetical protein